jgi:hypothetical protein
MAVADVCPMPIQAPRVNSHCVKHDSYKLRGAQDPKNRQGILRASCKGLE